MIDVAEKCEISKTTISHVIKNARFGEEDSHSRVLRAIKPLEQPRIAQKDRVGNCHTGQNNARFAMIVLPNKEVIRSYL